MDADGRRSKRQRVQLSERIVCDSQIHSGSPTVQGTRVATFVIAGRFLAGETIPEIADDYSIDSGAVEDALRYELERRRLRLSSYPKFDRLRKAFGVV